MIVRQLDRRDAIAYQSLRLRALLESPISFSASHEDESSRPLMEIEARVTPAVDGSLCIFGAFDEGGLAGFVAFVRPSRRKLHHVAELAGMYVDRQRRRNGVGRALLDAVVVHARSLGVRQLKLGVNATNTAAQQLYRAAGFERFAIEPDALHVDGVYHDEAFYLLRLDQVR
ncbi:MAG: GNAT family N-acetyltransferase [Rhodanobacter sp.]